MDIAQYQREAIKTAIYPDSEIKTYPLLGLIGEVGEFCNKYKKELRDGKTFSLEDASSELGDILWYIALVAEDFGLDLDDVARSNIAKLADRQNRGVLGGSGDNR